MPDESSFHIRTPQKHPCPMCGTPLPMGAVYCEHCKTDLGRAAVMLSSRVRPVSRKMPWRTMVLTLVAVLAFVGLALVGLDHVPAVSARVPMLKAISSTAADAVQRAWTLGRGLIPGAARAPGTPADSPQTTTPNPAPLPAPETLSLTVRSTPSGAEVHVNASKVGTTPLTITNVKPGTYQVRISRVGYLPVSRTVEVQKGKPHTLHVILQAASVGVRRPAPPSQAAPATRSAPPAAQTPRSPRGRAQSLLEVGARAPDFVLKDRLGVLHQLTDHHGRRVLVLFVWTLDPQARRAATELDARIRRGGPDQTALIVVMNPDRVAARKFVSTAQIRVPLLFGNERIAEMYGISRNVSVLYIISGQRFIERRQVISNQPTGALP